MRGRSSVLQLVSYVRTYVSTCARTLADGDSWTGRLPPWSSGAGRLSGAAVGLTQAMRIGSSGCGCSSSASSAGIRKAGMRSNYVAALPADDRGRQSPFSCRAMRCRDRCVPCRGGSGTDGCVYARQDVSVRLVRHIFFLFWAPNYYVSKYSAFLFLFLSYIFISFLYFNFCRVAVVVVVVGVASEK
jgi:hypothetical protein